MNECALCIVVFPLEFRFTPTHISVSPLGFEYNWEPPALLEAHKDPVYLNYNELEFYVDGMRSLFLEFLDTSPLSYSHINNHQGFAKDILDIQNMFASILEDLGGESEEEMERLWKFYRLLSTVPGPRNKSVIGLMSNFLIDFCKAVPIQIKIKEEYSWKKYIVEDT